MFLTFLVQTFGSLFYLLQWEFTLSDALFRRSVLLLTTVDRLSSIIYIIFQRCVGHKMLSVYANASIERNTLAN